MEIAQQGAGMTQGNRQGFPGSGRERRPCRQRLGTGNAVDATPVEQRRHRQLVFQGDFEFVAALEAKSMGRNRAPDRPDRRIRLSRTQGDNAGFGLQHERRASWRGGPRDRRWGKNRSAQPGDQVAPAQAENAICHG
jgi:hypothetical protein